MESNRPEQLEGISLNSVEVKGIDLKTLRLPEKDGKGYIQYSLTAKQRFKTKKGGSVPHGFDLNTTAILHAYEGEPPDDKKPVEGDQLMACEVSLIAHYRIGKPSASEEDLKKWAWHFQAQVAVLAMEYIRCALRDTPFATVPIPVEA